jgi:hypothetical protein
MRYQALVVALFVLGLVGGCTLASLPDGVARPLLPALARVGEPSSTSKVAAALVSGDSAALAEALNPTQLKALSDGLSPLIAIDEVSFVGAVTAANGDTLVAYLVRGKDPRGTRVMLGISFRVRNAAIVGVK